MSKISTILVPTESVNDDFVTLSKLYFKTGDYIKKDDLLAELETSKALVEIRSEFEGYITVFVKENTDIKVGEKMFEISQESMSIISDEQISFQIKNIDEKLSVTSKTIFSKNALKYIDLHNLDKNQFSDLSFVTTRTITKKNDLNLPDTESKKNKIENTIEKGTILKAISKNKNIEYEYLKSVNSSSVISRLSIFVKLASIESIQSSQNFIKSTPLPIIIHEVSRLLLKYPNLNSYYSSNGMQLIYENINIGIALDNNKNGLKVASIMNTDKMELYQIEEEILSISTRYTENKLKVEELTNSTFTITDLFNTSVLNFHPLVNYKNSCILGISSYQNNGFIIDFSFDHRLTSGKEVSIFLDELKNRLEKRFSSDNTLKETYNTQMKCVKCDRNENEDMDGDIYFISVNNSIYNGYICTKCLINW
jgi:pyruvate/2-oxoglutarate dehydrogenase complex dihydrolipoamide acyltransferase (E2) component